MISDPLDHLFGRPVVGSRCFVRVVEEKCTASRVFACQRPPHRIHAGCITLAGQSPLLHGSKLAWLMKHPAGVMPIVGSTKPERIRDAARAASLELSREEWYRLLVAAQGHPLD